MNYDDFQTGFNEADYLMQLGEYQSAIKLLLKYRKKYPGDSLVNFNLGVVYYKAGKFVKSIYSLEEAVRLGAEEPEVFNQLGLSSDSNGDLEGSRAYYKKALEMDSSFAMAWNNLGVTYFLAGDYLSAKVNFEKALELNSEDPDTWFNLRDSCTELGLDSEAEAADLKYHELLRH
ncbi:MAG: tetratricopeptide repeat protein [Spirochaetia bacterium]|jgi:tetratricopeptide (TPR) repeat protein|nr:tetratricopeptide repeat protein [Spirochaetia bacterium]